MIAAIFRDGATTWTVTCDQCGKEHVSVTTYRRPEGWYQVLRSDWMAHFCSSRCLRLFAEGFEELDGGGEVVP